MALEGLQVVLNKEAVLATASVDELLEAPQVVEERYKNHVRAYLPLGRVAGSREDQLSVQEYEKRLIMKAKEGSAPTGYITAEYGYGKTSTAAFLWQRCREANLLAVPPFNIRKLLDLLTAAYAWGRHELRRTRPKAGDELERLYRSYVERGIEADAGGHKEIVARLLDLQRQGRYSTNLNTADYLSFFEHYTALMLQAGYDGVVLLPDELQQYTDPTINSGERDPLSNLFQLVNGLATRKGMLKATVIFLMPTKELAQINDQRRDIVNRMEDGKLGFDLNNIYDSEFALRLWERLAREFEFTAEAGAIVEQSTLRGLGEIAARKDLGSGPRTVVDGFRVMIERYLAALDKSQAPVTYSPINLTEDLLNGKMSFASPKFKRDVNAALNNRLVAGQTERELAVKLLAAFPTNGAASTLIEELSLTTAVADLVEQQLTIYQGGRDAEGKLVQGITLRDLAPNQGGGDWLTSAISEFIRMTYTYQENSSKVIERAANAFRDLLRKRVFKGKWRVADDVTATAMRDAALLLEGSLPQTAEKYPDRSVYLKIVRDGNRADTALPPVDLIIEFDLRRYITLGEGDRRKFAGDFDDHDAHHLKFALNVSHQSSDEIYPTLQQNLGNIVSPQRLTPLLLLNIYAYLDEQLAANHVPKTERSFVEDSFMPDLLDVAVMELFNPDLTKGKSGGTRIIEDAFVKSMREQFPSYVSILGKGLNKAVAEYVTALQRLPNPYQRNGSEVYSGSKEEIAALLNRTNTTLDTFISDYPSLLKVTRDWKAKQSGEVLFTLHPWEQVTMNELGNSRDFDPLSKQPRLAVRELKREAAKAGYRDEEIDALLVIMAQRGLAEVRDGYLVRKENKAVSINDLRQRLNAHLIHLANLLSTFSGDSVLLDQHSRISAFLNELDGDKPPADQVLANREAILANYISYLDNWRRGKQEEIARNLRNVKPAEGPGENERAEIGRPYQGPLREQIEPLRERAAAEVEAISKELTERSHEYRALLQIVPAPTAGNPPLADNALIAVRKEFDKLNRNKSKSDTDASHARQRVSDWREVKRVMTQAEELKRDIDAEGQEGAPALAAYHDWERKVREQLSVNKLNAFAAVSDWHNDLSRVRTQLALVRETAAGNFNALQAAYRSTLRKAGIPDERMPRPTEYNSHNPENSRSRLRADMHDSWVAVVKQLAKMNQELGDDVQRIRAALNSDMEAHSREQLRHQCDELSAQLASNREPIAALLEAEAALAGGPEQFGQLLMPLGEVQSRLTQIRRQVEEAQSSLSRHAPSEAARQTYHRFRERPASDDGYIDAAAVMDGQDGQRDQFWRDLGELQDKQLIRVKVQVIKND